MEGISYITNFGKKLELGSTFTASSFTFNFTPPFHILGFFGTGTSSMITNLGAIRMKKDCANLSKWQEDKEDSTTTGTIDSTTANSTSTEDSATTNGIVGNQVTTSVDESESSGAKDWFIRRGWEITDFVFSTGSKIDETFSPFERKYVILVAMIIMFVIIALLMTCFLMLGWCPTSKKKS